MTEDRAMLACLRLASLFLPVNYMQCTLLIWGKRNVYDPTHSSLWPLGCWSALEPKIEIPDTLVVNIAHASPAVEQKSSFNVWSRMWNIQAMRLCQTEFPHDNNLALLHPLTHVPSRCGWMCLETEFLCLRDSDRGWYGGHYIRPEKRQP